MAAKAERGAPLPEWYLEEPLAGDATRFVVAAFWELSTERYMGWVPGYIPQHRIDDYAERKGVLPGMMTVFTAAVRTCDEEYLSSLTRKRGRRPESKE